MTTFELYFCATLLRGALAVLFLLAAEALLRRRLGTGFRRLLWMGCLILMLFPQMNFSASPFRLDLSPLRSVAAPASSPRLAGEGGGRERSVLTESGPGDSVFHKLQLRLQAHRRSIEMWAIALLPLPMLLLLLCRYLRCRRMIRPLPPVSDRRILIVWNRVLAECGPLRRPVILLDSGGLELGPTLFGCFTCKLLLPVGKLKELTDTELRLLLEHEYHHGKAGDPFLNILALALWAFVWYNPFVLIVRRRLRACCELECDRKILARHPHAVQEYGRLLLRFAAPTSIAAVPAALGLAESPRELSRRIRSLTTGGGRASGRWIAILLIVALISPICLVAINTRSRSRSVAVKKVALELPQKPMLPHLALTAYMRDAAIPELIYCATIQYSEQFPFAQSRLRLQLKDGKSLEVQLAPEKRVLLLWRTGDEDYRAEALELSALPERAKVFSRSRILTPGQVPYVFFSSESHLGFQLTVDGVDLEDLSGYRNPVPAYR